MRYHGQIFKDGSNCRKVTSGFTVVEVIITVIIFVLIITISSMLLSTGSDSWDTNSIQTEIQQELRKAMDWMKNDLIQSGSSTITNVPADGTPYNTITFQVATGVTNGNIVWSSSTIQFLRSGNDLQKISGTETKTLARDISSLTFRRQASSPNIVEVSLQVQKTTSKNKIIANTLNFSVKLRNE